MQFIKDTTENVHLITGLDAGAIRINEEVIQGSIVLSAEGTTEWPVQSVEQISDEHWSVVLEREPEIVLLGTGDRLVFPTPRQLKSAIDRQIGVEVMDTEAACRTYNLLVHEGRKVTAALIIA